MIGNSASLPPLEVKNDDLRGLRICHRVVNAIYILAYRTA